MERKVTVVMYADAVGYSALMRKDEACAIKSIRHHLTDLVQAVEQFGGKRRGGAGDSLLATFPGVQPAMACATQFQSRVLSDPDLYDIRFRIGLHMGDAIDVDGQLFGDSVNVAARLEPLAGANGICVSSAIRDALRGVSEYTFRSVGRPNLKNIGNDIEVFHLLGFGPPPAQEFNEAPVPAIEVDPRDTLPSVAVLPFETYSSRDDLRALAVGFAGEVVGYLTRFRGLDVIAPHSSLGALGNTALPDLNTLGVGYVITGAVQLSERRLRVRVALQTAERQRTIWTEKYDRTFEDIFDVQEDVAECSAAAMAVQIEDAERLIARARPAESLDAYALQLRARDAVFLNQPDTCRTSKELIGRALEISPYYARCYAVLARAHHLDWKYSWSADPEQSFHAAHSAAMRALEIDRSDAKGQAEVGSVSLYRREHERALAAFSRALELNPSDADIIGEYADALKHAGEKDEAIKHFQRAMRLNPVHSDRYRRDLSHAYLTNGDYLTARKTILDMTDPTQAIRVLVASCAHAGFMEDAHNWAVVLRKKHPGFSAREWAKIVPDKDPADTELLIDGLGKAGL